MKAALVVVGALALLPPACEKLVGKGAEPSAQQDPPPPVPVTSATTPPIWHPPEPPATATITPAATSSASPEYTKAKTAADSKDWKKVRALLDKKARAGKATTDEAQLALSACTALKDKACAEAIRAKYPDLAQ